MVCGTLLATVAEAMPHSVHWKRAAGPGEIAYLRKCLEMWFDLEVLAKKLDFKELLPGYSVGVLILLACERMNQTGSRPPAPSVHQLCLLEYELVGKTIWCRHSWG